MLGGNIVEYLSNRLQIVDYHQQHPELANAPIEAPIVILGFPRTGTTVLSYLLDQDPQWRSLLNWEAVRSVPPPSTDTLRTDDRCTDMLAFQRDVLPMLDPPPPHWEWADGPTECAFRLAQDLNAFAHRLTLGEIGGIYDWLGVSLDTSVDAAMRGWLDIDPLEASRKSSYSLADFGVDRGELLERFSDYINAFNVEVNASRANERRRRRR